MKKLLILAGLSVVLAAPAFAGPDNKHDYNLYVVADGDTESAVYVITHDGETVAVEVYDEDEEARWLKDRVGLKLLAQAEEEFGPTAKGKGKGFAFSINGDDVHIAFPLPFFKHVSIHASDDDDEAQVRITSKDGEGDIFVQAHDDHAFISVLNASAKDAREFIDDIDEAPKAMRRKMKKELDLD